MPKDDVGWLTAAAPFICLFFFLLFKNFYLCFPGDSDGKESTCHAGDLGLIPGLRRSLEEGMETHSSNLA